MPPSDPDAAPQDRVASLADAAVQVARKAKKHRKSLAGANFYADKLAQLRSDATNAFNELSSASVGDVSAIAELIQACFSPATPAKERAAVARELRFQLSTPPWSKAPRSKVAGEEDAIFPLGLLAQTKRGYLSHVGRQMNGCFVSGWFDACAVMMRRLVETAIIEAFEGRGVAAKAMGPGGDFLQLSELIAAALKEPTWHLSRNTKAALPKLRDVGHLSAHSRRYNARRSDIEKVQPDCRIAVEELLTIAGLL